MKISDLEAEKRKRPNHSFAAINVPNNWERIVSKCFLQRFEIEVLKNNDVVEITDLKCKLYSSVSYNSKHGIDYDDFLDNLAELESKQYLE